MSKKKKILLVVAILSSILLAFIGGHSYAKYASQVKVEGVADVARWSFHVNGNDSATKTVKLTSTIDNETLKEGRIAPGTNGNFHIIVDSTGSDVGVNYNIKFNNETTKPQNLKFIYNNNEYNSLENLESALSGTIDANDTNKVKDLKVEWKWDYETGSNEAEINSNDQIDTQDAQNIANYTFDVIVSGTQVVPSK